MLLSVHERSIRHDPVPSPYQQQQERNVASSPTVFGECSQCIVAVTESQTLLSNNSIEFKLTLPARVLSGAHPHILHMQFT